LPADAVAAARGDARRAVAGVGIGLADVQDLAA